MNLAEHREVELEILSQRKHVTYQELAEECGVSRETIRKDIIALMCSHPIGTVRGRYGGGVKVLPGFSLRPKTLTSEQAAFLEDMKSKVTADNLPILQSILDDFAP